MKTQTTAKPQRIRWIRRPATKPRAHTIAAVFTGFCGLIALVSAAGKLTNQAAVVELLDHVEVHGVLRDLLQAANEPTRSPTCDIRSAI